MNFVSLEFAFFFLLVLTADRIFRQRLSTGNAFLLAFSLLFYAWGGWVFLPLLLALATLDWAAGRLLACDTPGQEGDQGNDGEVPAGERRLILWCALALHLLVLGFFKYYEFLMLELAALANLAGWNLHIPLDDLLFPMGLSFYTFQGMAYVVDCWRGQIAAQSFWRVLLFVSFFPTVMAGPILRGGQFFPQLEDRSVQERDMIEGFALILSGLFKKVVLASYLSEHVVRDVFQAPELYSSWAVLAAVYGYTIQIFCDFSGYSDLALGIGRLMGFRLPVNFRAPYLALNLQDFWRRWHISLSLWLRDYLYIPLGGNRRGSKALNLVITMGLGGIWHGSQVRFLVWGLMHGVGLAVVHVWHRFKAGPGPLAGALNRLFSSWPGKVLAWLLTFHTVAVLWIFFRAEDMPRALEMLRRMLWWGQGGDGFPVLVLPALVAGLAVQYCGPRVMAAFVAVQARLPWPLQVATLALAAGLILKMGPDGVLPFIYFQF